MVYVTRRETFSASHRLYNPALSEAQNLQIFDKCSNAHGHGHNYEIEVTIVGRVHPESGYVVDLKLLKEVIYSEIIVKVDHKHLNHDVEMFRDVIPTAENIARVFWKVLATKLPGVHLHAIRVRETENNVVEYRGEL